MQNAAFFQFEIVREDAVVFSAVVRKGGRIGPAVCHGAVAVRIVQVILHYSVQRIPIQKFRIDVLLVGASQVHADAVLFGIQVHGATVVNGPARMLVVGLGGCGKIDIEPRQAPFLVLDFHEPQGDLGFPCHEPCMGGGVQAGVLLFGVAVGDFLFRIAAGGAEQERKAGDG